MKIFCFISTKWTSKKVFLLHLSSCSSVEGKRSSAGQLPVKAQPKSSPKARVHGSAAPALQNTAGTGRGLGGTEATGSETRTHLLA